ncbi:MAG TPA: PIG-L family deacetylase [Bacteroidales bacterium]|nr:PIG-L family deacetylase [Bacteroidales bacterium]
MKRRSFISNNLAIGAMIPASYATMGLAGQNAGHPIQNQEEVIIEKPREDKPHKGKVLAVIQPHCDDIPIFAAGTVAKLIYEGYTGYLIRTTNDEAAGSGATSGERFLNNEKDNAEVARVLGLKKTYDLNYANHRMDEYNIQEIKGRLIFLFRLLKVDTLISYDPWGLYEENPDHYITARAVEAARWMAGMGTDYPEQLEVVQPHTVKEMYYHARGPQIVNRVVDISRFIDTKVESNIVCKTQGPGGNAGSRLRLKMAADGKKLPILGNDDRTANFNYIKEFVLEPDRINGAKYGLEWAECFHYIGPPTSSLDNYIQKNAITL